MGSKLGKVLRFLHRSGIVLYVLFIATVGYTNLHYDSLHQVDKDTFHSRIAGVGRTCKQFNKDQAILRDLVTVSLAAPRPRGLDAEGDRAVERARASFREDLKKLAPNDCVGMRRKLEEALKDGDFSQSVPYEPKSHPND